MIRASAQEEGHHLYLNLVDIDEATVAVTLAPPALEVDTAIYNMPKIVPGTYSISDFGRFVEGFYAISKNGDTLDHTRLDTNRWAIGNARELDHVGYRISDTFHQPMGGGIFEPGGTNIEPDKNVLLNAFGFVGYFDGTKHAPFEVTVERPQNWYGATSLTRQHQTESHDYFTASNYFELHDCPILYAEPDTTSLKVANAVIEVAVYSPKGVVTSGEVMREVEDIFEASAAYLGGTLPVDRYTILLYLSGDQSFSRGYGALEHNTSTVFVLPEVPVSALAQTIKDVAAHEFFHIVTPLNIHSEQIHDYDFVYPKMSKHLWLYEGSTEYAAQHVQVKQGLVSPDVFLKNMRSKILASKRYREDVPFTEISMKALDEFKNEYPNVYQKGALLGMALDLKLRYLSEGAYGSQDLMSDLSQAYGQDRPFLDDSLFAIIARISGFPEMEDFLWAHVGGTEPLDYASLLAPFGVIYADSLTEKVLSGGSITLGYNPRRESMVVASTASADAFGKSLGLEVGDEMVTWDGRPVTLDTYENTILAFKEKRAPGEKFKIVVRKKSKDYKKEKIKAVAMEVDKTQRHALRMMDAPTPDQIALRKSWIGQ